MQLYLLSIIALLTLCPTTAEICNSDGVCTTAIGDEKNAQDYYDKASHYDQLWGRDNLHIGYYPHLSLHSDSSIELTPEQAGIALTERMIRSSNISAGDRVLDLGSGKGLACAQIASLTGASCVGIDRSPENVARGREIADQFPDLKLSYHEGSFTDISDELLELTEGGYDVVFSQVAFCHAHEHLHEIFEEVLRVLKPGGLLVVNDYLGGDAPPSSETLEHVYKRLHFTQLYGHRAWRRAVDAAGALNDDGEFEMLVYENLDVHMERFYVDLAAGAHRKGLVSTDGAKLGSNYEITARVIANKEIGMNLAILRKIPSVSLD